MPAPPYDCSNCEFSENVQFVIVGEPEELSIPPPELRKNVQSEIVGDEDSLSIPPPKSATELSEKVQLVIIAFE